VKSADRLRDRGEAAETRQLRRHLFLGRLVRGLFRHCSVYAKHLLLDASALTNRGSSESFVGIYG